MCGFLPANTYSQYIHLQCCCHAGTTAHRIGLHNVSVNWSGLKASSMFFLSSVFSLLSPLHSTWNVPKPDVHWPPDLYTFMEPYELYSAVQGTEGEEQDYLWSVVLSYMIQFTNLLLRNINIMLFSPSKSGMQSHLFLILALAFLQKRAGWSHWWAQDPTLYLNMLHIVWLSRCWGVLCFDLQ